MANECKECKHSALIEDSALVCKRYPPQIFRFSTERRDGINDWFMKFPYVYERDTCGEFAPAETATEETGR